MKKEIFGMFLFILAQFVYLFAGHIMWFKVWGPLALVSCIFQVWTLIFFPYSKFFPQLIKEWRNFIL